MNFTPKVGPLVAELLSGFTVVLLAYFTLYHIPSAPPLHDNPGAALAIATLLAWLLGTFIDAIRNLLEWVWDWFSKEKFPWEFLLHGEPDKVSNLENYFLSFYRLDGDIAIAIFLFVLFAPSIISALIAAVSPPCWIRFVLLPIIWFVFVLDAFLLRKEMRDYINDKQPF
jgi:hypothetical protein